MGRITWRIGDFGHLHIWKGPDFDGIEEDSDLFIQNDVEIEDFQDLMGLSDEELQAGGEAEDPGYFI